MKRFEIENCIEIRNENGYVIASAIICSTNGSERCMLTAYESGDGRTGTEYYKGSNYIVGDNTRSYSRNYREHIGVPVKYSSVKMKLMKKVIDEVETNGFK